MRMTSRIFVFRSGRTADELLRVCLVVAWQGCSGAECQTLFQKSHLDGNIKGSRRCPFPGTGRSWSKDDQMPAIRQALRGERGGEVSRSGLSHDSWKRDLRQRGRVSPCTFSYIKSQSSSEAGKGRRSSSNPFDLCVISFAEVASAIFSSSLTPIIKSHRRNCSYTHSFEGLQVRPNPPP